MLTWIGEAHEDSLLSGELSAVNGCLGRGNSFTLSGVATGTFPTFQ